MTPFEKYILNYRDDKGDLVCNIPDYYLLKVSPLDAKFSNHRLSETRLAICPLHNDHDPSFGIMKRKYPEGSYSFHCFGCGRSGTVIRLHQFISDKYFNKQLSVYEACSELCEIFGIPIPDLTDIADDDYQGLFNKRYNHIEHLANGYNDKDFAEDILKVRKHGVTLNAVNSACIKLIATKKGLYDKG